MFLHEKISISFDNKTLVSHILFPNYIKTLFSAYFPSANVRTYEVTLGNLTKEIQLNSSEAYLPQRAFQTDRRVKDPLYSCLSSNS